jgi:hypothetical protein
LRGEPRLAGEHLDGGAPERVGCRHTGQILGLGTHEHDVLGSVEEHQTVAETGEDVVDVLAEKVGGRP